MSRPFLQNIKYIKIRNICPKFIFYCENFHSIIPGTDIRENTSIKCLVMTN